MPSIPEALVQQIGVQVVDALARGVTGDQFADSLVTFYGEAVYERIASFGQAGIMSALQSLPQLWAQLAPVQPQLEQFVSDFLGYGQETPAGARPGGGSGMTAACSLCKALVQTPAVAVLDEHRQALEWRALGDRMADHVLRFHPEAASRLLAFVSIFTHWLLSFLFESLPEFTGSRDLASGLIKDLLVTAPDHIVGKLAPAATTSTPCPHTPKLLLRRRNKPRGS